MYYVGVDLGGTNIAVGIVDENKKILFNECRHVLDNEVALS